MVHVREAPEVESDSRMIPEMIDVSIEPNERARPFAAPYEGDCTDGS